MIFKTIVDPDDLAQLPVTISVTMSYGEWNQLKGDLGKSSPSMGLWSHIYTALNEIGRGLSGYTKVEEGVIEDQKIVWDKQLNS